MNLLEFKKNYLNHYCLLEQDFIETSKYVTISENNFNTYSSAYLKLLLTIGSEIDVMLDLLSKLYDPTSKETGFGCSKTILKHEKDIKSLEIQIKNEDFSVYPWNSNGIPEWWTAYNEIKHNRNEKATKFDSSKKYYQYANLQNVLTSLAALLSLEFYTYRLLAIKENEKVFVPNIKSIFKIKNSYWKDIEFGNGIIIMDGNLYIE